jgi:hypothetical protein
MGTNDDSSVTTSGYGDDDGLLGPERVWESLSSNAFFLRFQNHVLDLGKEPLRCLGACHSL